MESPLLSFFLPLPLPLLLAQMTFSFRKFLQAQALGEARGTDPGLAGLPACRRPSLPRCADRAGGSGPRGGGGNYPSQSRRRKGSTVASQMKNYMFSPKLLNSKGKSESPEVSQGKALLESHLPLLRCQRIPFQIYQSRGD